MIIIHQHFKTSKHEMLIVDNYIHNIIFYEIIVISYKITDEPTPTLTPATPTPTPPTPLTPLTLTTDTISKLNYLIFLR